MKLLPFASKGANKSINFCNQVSSLDNNSQLTQHSQEHKQVNAIQSQSRSSNFWAPTSSHSLTAPTITRLRFSFRLWRKSTADSHSRSTHSASKTSRTFSNSLEEKSATIICRKTNSSTSSWFQESKGPISILINKQTSKIERSLTRPFETILKSKQRPHLQTMQSHLAKNPRKEKRLIG